MSSYQVKYADQFSFKPSYDKLVKLFTRNVKPDLTQVNVAGITIRKIKKNKSERDGKCKDESKCKCESPYYKVLVVVGQGFPSDENEAQISQFKQNLNYYNICYKIAKIIQIYNIGGNTGEPGQLRKTLALLYCNGIVVKNVYLGEAETAIGFYIEVNRRCLTKAFDLIRSFDPTKEASLCINRNTI